MYTKPGITISYHAVSTARYAGNVNQEYPGFGNMVMQMRQQALMQQMGIPTAQAPVVPGMNVIGGGMHMASGGLNIDNVCRSIMAAVSFSLINTQTFIKD